MSAITPWLALALTAATALGSPALAQYIPPHSNDPHPPANQPAYQLPGPLSRPGVGQYPGASHSNDPHFSKTEAQPSWPKPAATIPPWSGSKRVRRPYPEPTPPAFRAKTADERAATKDKTSRKSGVSLQQCYAKWDGNLGLSRASWESNCRRLAADGRIGMR